MISELEGFDSPPLRTLAIFNPSVLLLDAQCLPSPRAFPIFILPTARVMAILLCPLLFALFARGVIAQFLNPPNSNATGGISGLQLVEGSTVVVSWNLPSDATQAQSKLYLWLNPGVTGFILTGTP